MKEDKSMTERARRKELVAQYKQSLPEAGVYRIVNSKSNKALLGSTPNLAGIRGKLQFAKSINSLGAPDQQLSTETSQFGTWLRGHYRAKGEDQRLSEDIQQFGVNAFSMEVLEVLETKAEMSQAEILRDLVALEELWREKLDPSLLY